MIITYCGNTCIKAQVGDVSISFNPPLRNDGKTPRFSSNIALFSTKEKDQNFAHSDPTNNVFIIDGPGEYEVGGIFIKGTLVEKEIDGKKKLNTIYSVLFDGINLCHLGAISTANIDSEAVNSMGSVDVLFTPITGGDMATPATASKLVKTFGPHVVIPLSGTEKGVDSAALKMFLKEEGAEDVEPSDKLTTKKKDIDAMQDQVIVLNPTS